MAPLSHKREHGGIAKIRVCQRTQHQRIYYSCHLTIVVCMFISFNTDPFFPFFFSKKSNIAAFHIIMQTKMFNFATKGSFLLCLTHLETVVILSCVDK